MEDHRSTGVNEPLLQGRGRKNASRSSSDAVGTSSVSWRHLTVDNPQLYPAEFGGNIINFRRDADNMHAGESLDFDPVSEVTDTLSF